MHQPSVAIIILNWNGKKFLEQFLPSVLGSSYNNKRIIVADNASTDDSIAFLKNVYPQVELLTHHENLGFAAGYNHFLNQVEADYYVLLNSDVEVANDWIEPIINLMERDEYIAAAQPKLMAWNQKNEFEYAGAGGGWLDALGYPFSRGRLFDNCEKDEGQYNDTAPVFWASGAALFIRSRCFHEMKGFDDFFFAHMEEIDLCWRLQRSGYKIYVCPQSVVYHVGAGTLPKGSERKVFLNFRNNLIMLTKNLPLGEIIWKLPVRIALDAISAWKELLLGYPRYFKGVLHAHFSYLRWLFIVGKRWKAPHPPLTGWYNGSIIWQHFIRGRKKFSEIVNTK